MGQDLHGALAGRLGLLVGDELAELGLVLVANRLLERDRRLRAALDRIDLLGLDARYDLGDLLRGRLAAERRDQAALRAPDLVELLDDVDGDPDRARLVGERTGDRLPDPPGGIGRELETLADSRTLPPRALGRRCPLGSGRGTAGPGCGSSSRSRRRGAGSTRPCLASRSPRQIRLARSTSCWALSSRTLPMSFRNSCREPPTPRERHAIRATWAWRTSAQPPQGSVWSSRWRRIVVDASSQATAQPTHATSRHDARGRHRLGAISRER